MKDSVDPQKLGLHPRTVLEKVGSDTVVIVIRRKSRIIMADGRKIIEKAEKIRQAMPKVTVALKTTAPVCSKTLSFLEAKGVPLIIDP